MIRKWTKTDPEQLVTAEEVVAIMAKAGRIQGIREQRQKRRGGAMV